MFSRPVGGNEFVRLEGGADFSQQCGMEVAKSFSCILLNNNNFTDFILPRMGLNLTALGLSPVVHPAILSVGPLNFPSVLIAILLQLG